MRSFSVPFVAPNPDSWGPPSMMMTESLSADGSSGSNPNEAASYGNVLKFSTLPYAPFGRSDRLGRAADFTSSGHHRHHHHHHHHHHHNHGGGGQGGGFGGDRRGSGGDHRRGGGGRDFRQSGGRGGGGGGFHDRIPEDSAMDGSGLGGFGGSEEESFQLVDTTKTPTTKRFTNPTARRRQHSAKLRQINARRQAAGGGPGANVGIDKLTGRGHGGHRSSNRNFGGGGRGGRGHDRGYGNRVDRQASVSVQEDWKEVESIDLAKLTKHLIASTEVPTPNDIVWCGFLDPYNDAFDKITPRQPNPLKRMEHKEFYPVTTTDDPVLEKLAIEGSGQVFITDTILAHLMTCTRSVYPWDIVIQKLPGGTLFFDKRDNSQFDYLTVHETSYTPPLDDTGINTPERLGLEATMINQNFSQQILKKSGRKQMDLPNPFFDEDDADGMEPASVAFRYRKFSLDAETTLVCRTELHGMVKKSQYMTAFALNEYTPLLQTTNASGQTTTTSSTTQTSTANAQNTMSWRDKIDSQRGAVLATELKNNSFKLAKWTAQSLLASADQMKIGFVSRTSPKVPYEHVILATQFYRPKDFATQITLSEGQMWAMIRMFVQLLQKQDDGKYVLMRNPNKALLTLYKVPPETFEDEE